MPPLEENGFLGKDIRGWIDKFRAQFKEWFELADELNRHCHALMFKIDAHSGDMEEVLVATLYLRSMTTFQSVVLLAERGLTAQGKMLARCMFDSIFPLCAISNDRDHKYFVDYIEADLISRKNFTKKYRKLTTAKEEHLRELNALESELKKEIENGKVKELKTLDWAKRAGLEDWYHSAYSTLSVRCALKSRRPHTVSCVRW